MKLHPDIEQRLLKMAGISEPEEPSPSKFQEGRYRSMELLLALCQPGSIQTVVVDGDPVSKARPRFSHNGKPYTPTKTVEGEKRIAARLFGIKPFASNVAVACVFYRASRQRIDVDNLMKAVLDAGTRAHIWEDDCQVTALVGMVEHDADHPRTVVSFGEHSSTLLRGDAALRSCETCGKRFKAGGSRRRDAARWCSRECATYLAEPVPCPECGEPFRRTSSGRKFCSIRCRGIAQSRNDKAARATKTHCRRGHLLDEQNTYVLSNGNRRCRRCQADQALAYRNRKAE